MLQILFPLQNNLKARRLSLWSTHLCLGCHDFLLEYQYWKKKWLVAAPLHMTFGEQCHTLGAKHLNHVFSKQCQTSSTTLFYRTGLRICIFLFNFNIIRVHLFKNQMNLIRLSMFNLCSSWFFFFYSTSTILSLQATERIIDLK